VQPSGRVVLSHSGAFSIGAGTNYVLIPSARVGIVILTNAPPVGVAETLGMEFADLVQFGKVTRDWFTAYAGLLARSNAPFGTRVGKQLPANPAPALDLAVYAGTYTNDYFGDAVIVRQRDGLMLKIGPMQQNSPSPISMATCSPSRRTAKMRARARSRPQPSPRTPRARSRR